eukprot:scaffold23516_cov127-Cylindrotheca_fusiformis.AAC.1
MAQGKNRSPVTDETPLDVDNGSETKSLSSQKSAILPAAEDPFAYREGKTLLWRDINMTLAGKKNSEPVKLLEGVWGEVPEQKTTAIMGPSGA